MGKRMIKNQCGKCGGSGMTWTTRAGVHSSDKKRVETVRVQEPCRECGGRGWHAIFVEEK